jgi:hypothetical protein
MDRAIRLTLTNSYHATTATLIVSGKTISQSQVSRARRKLCGIDGCECSDFLGRRGRQEYADSYAIEQTRDGARLITL